MAPFTVPDGMPRAIFENKYSRRKDDGKLQSWIERIQEVVEGNFSLVNENSLKNGSVRAHREDLNMTLDLASRGVMPFSGRHLQHGDMKQKDKAGECFTNCSTSAFSFVQFWLLLKGSGVGRCYDADVCRVNWDYMPEIRLVMEGPDPVTGLGGHANYESWIESSQAAHHKYDSESDRVRWFTVEDSAEGWQKIIQILETSSYHRDSAEKLFIFDFSGVRPEGSPIAGQQGRPSSGPVPLIKALMRVSTIKGAGMQPWKQAMFVDHYLAQCVQVGGIRRSARIAVKSWRERDVFDFIEIKRGGWLFTANNSILVDKEFWKESEDPRTHAARVLQAAVAAGYYDSTGEPGFQNVDQFSWNDEGVEDINEDTIFSDYGRKTLDLAHQKTLSMMGDILRAAKKKAFPFLTNPCGEIILAAWGGYCVIGDICLANAETLGDTIEAARLMSQFLIRTNTMDFLYGAEVQRTNRIGVGATGWHEFAYTAFGYTFHDLLDEEKSQDFWNHVRTMRLAAEFEAERYASVLEVGIPHTVTTVKPSGTISKVMACSEGAHLPAYDYYVRWVQYSASDPELERLTSEGYPTKDISHQYEGHVVVGFPTKMPITNLMGDAVTCAEDVTPEEQFQWLRLLEKYWLGKGNNQISFTLKYDPDQVSYDAYLSMIKEQQPTVRVCSMMPQTDLTAYAYVPEDRIVESEYLKLMSTISATRSVEAYDTDLLLCTSGACPIEPDRYETPPAT